MIRYPGTAAKFVSPPENYFTKLRSTHPTLYSNIGEAFNDSDCASRAFTKAKASDGHSIAYHFINGHSDIVEAFVDHWLQLR